MSNQCLQQINNFKYLGCEIFYQNEKDIQQKLARFAHILGILNNIFKQLCSQNFQQWNYIMHWPSPFFHFEEKPGPWGGEKKNNNNDKERDRDKMTDITIEMKFFGRRARYNRCDHKRKGEILEELKVEPVDDRLRRYKSNWLWHLTKMNNNMMPKIMLNYRSYGWRQLGRDL